MDVSNHSLNIMQGSVTFCCEKNIQAGVNLGVSEGVGARVLNRGTHKYQRYEFQEGSRAIRKGIQSNAPLDPPQIGSLNFTRFVPTHPDTNRRYIQSRY